MKWLRKKHGQIQSRYFAESWNEIKILNEGGEKMVPAITTVQIWAITLATKKKMPPSNKVNHKLQFKIYTKICKEKYPHGQIWRMFVYLFVKIWCDDGDLTPNSSWRFCYCCWNCNTNHIFIRIYSMFSFMHNRFLGLLQKWPLWWT